MYEEIGKKIKILAKVSFVIGIIVSIILGFYIIKFGKSLNQENVVISGKSLNQENVVIVGIIVIIVGIIISWISSWALYCIGESNEKVDILLHKFSVFEKNEKEKNIELQSINKIKWLYSKGMISEAEYQKALNRHQ